MKQRITLGLLVLFLGILITACGKKKSNNNNQEEQPKVEAKVTFGNIKMPANCNGTCSTSLTGTFTIENAKGYADIFLLNKNGFALVGNQAPTLYKDGKWNDQFANQFFGNVANTAGNLLYTCGTGMIIAKIAEKLGAKEANVACSYAESNRVTAASNLGSSYDVTVQYNFDNRYSGNSISSIILIIDRSGSRDTMEFFRKNDHTFYNKTSNYEIALHGERIDFNTPNGRIGYITQ